jgi:putative thiamine transport system ATP-binding protein
VSGLRLVNVHLAAAGRSLVSGLDLVVEPGEVAALMGPSGCGKSSLLALVGGSLDPGITAVGEVWLNGTRVDRLPAEKRRIGILFQDDLLFPHLSVGENLAFALPRAIASRDERRARIEAALVEAGLAGFAERDPATLSGGQRARVAMMRALLAEPKALLLDEAFAALDTVLRRSFRAFVFDHARAAGLPVLMATHDPADAEAAEARIVAPWVAGGAVAGDREPHRAAARYLQESIDEGRA